jgi:hypothetical protein
MEVQSRIRQVAGQFAEFKTYMIFNLSQQIGYPEIIAIQSIQKRVYGSGEEDISFFMPSSRAFLTLHGLLNVIAKFKKNGLLEKWRHMPLIFFSDGQHPL